MMKSYSWIRKSTTATLRMSSTTARDVNNILQHKFSVAPMMEYTDTHMRRLHRMISAESVLYTEMITTNTLVRCDEPARYLEADFPAEEPLVLQLGGSEPASMKKATEISVKYGYREININAGCPSEKVSGAGCFGAALMLQPDLLSALALSVGEVLGKPATVKCRIGVNNEDSYEGLVKFIDHVSRQGQVEHFIVHARKAVLGAKFSPADNRKIPPLKYDYVHNLVKDFPHLKFTINGGINSLQEAKAQLDQGVHGVMVGRACVNSPFHWRHTDTMLYGAATDPDVSRRDILTRYALYAGEQEVKHGRKLRSVLIKPVLQLFAGEPNGRLFRNQIDSLLRRVDLSISEVILEAAKCLWDVVLDLKASDPVVSYLTNGRVWTEAGEGGQRDSRSSSISISSSSADSSDNGSDSITSSSENSDSSGDSRGESSSDGISSNDGISISSSSNSSATTGPLIVSQ
jgi:tRNA-dihydrouridine synthase A